MPDDTDRGAGPSPAAGHLPAVEDVLPHRGRYLLLERLVELNDEGVRAEGSFSVEDVEGHFPGQPVVPGVLLLEGLAQTMACAHLLQHGSKDSTPFLAGFEKVRFRAPVLPPARVDYIIRFKGSRFGLFNASGEVRVDDRRVCTARLTGALAPADALPDRAPDS